MLITPYFAPQDYGGAVKLFDTLLGRLKAFDVTVLTDRQYHADKLDAFDRLAPATRGYKVLRLDRLTIHFRSRNRCLNVFDALHFFIKTSRDFDRVIRREQPDIIICGASYCVGWLMNRLPKAMTRVNYVLGEELTQALNYGPLARRFRRAQLKLLKTADMNIAISAFTAETLTRLTDLRAEAIRHIPCFIDTERFHLPQNRDALRNDLDWQGRTVLLTIARLVARKGVDQVLRALANIGHQLPEDWLYVIAGQGPELDALKNLSHQLGLSDRIRFLGFVADEKIPKLYGAADLFVQTNRTIQGDTEGFGIVYLEANACGLPVIGGTAGGTADAIEDGVSGIRVDGDNLVEIQEALLDLMTQPQKRQALARTAHERAVKDFGVENVTRRIESVLLEALEKKNSAPTRL